MSQEDKVLFRDGFKWSTITSDKRGLPRPSFDVPEKYHKSGARKKLAKIIPIPWQSIPRFDGTQGLELDFKKEREAFLEGLCSYCGLSFESNDQVSRWNFNPLKTSEKKDLVPSDIYPLHVDCMEQARLFCPFMRQLQDRDFEMGTYQEVVTHIDVNLQSRILAKLKTRDNKD